MLFLVGVFLLFVILGFPIAFSIGLTSALYLAVYGIPLITLAQKMVTGIDTFALLAVPFFILAGNLMNTGGVTRRLFRFATALIGHIPGGLGHANVVASIIFAGMSGAAIADAGGLGTIEIKAMKDEGFDTGFSAAITAASSTIGPIIPPSIPMVLYSAFSNTSVGKLFLAGVIPGLLMGVALMGMVYLISIRRNYPVHAGLRWGEVWASLKDGILPLMTPVIILGGILGGIFSPTEAAIAASAYALVLGAVIYREIGVREMMQIFLDTVKTTSIVLFIISNAAIYGWLLAREQVPQNVARLMFSLTTDPRLVLLIILVFLLIVGCFLETTAALIILVPILVPAVMQLGIDPVHFGLVMVLDLMIGLITPPVGVVLYVVADIAKISFEETVRATAPFIVPLVVVLLLVTFAPGLVMFLPNLLIP
jgi:tripartite ATP-independent transporter DctM subunit